MKKSTERSFTVKDHIGIFDNYFSDEECDKYIRYFDKFLSEAPKCFFTNSFLCFAEL